MKILGIDPGVAIIGYGIIEEKNKMLKLINSGCIFTKAGTPHPERLSQISKKLLKIIKKYKPDILAVEELFFCKNVKTALKVGEARGVILATAMQFKLPIREFTPLQIKQALTGYGRADKNQIQQMVKIILNLKKIIKQDDAADAVATAITCANTVSLFKLKPN
ncbi:MAG: crossover junction endodeoxyribonuclease RuvC [Candidatus Kuenenbacteria bacterium]